MFDKALTMKILLSFILMFACARLTAQMLPPDTVNIPELEVFSSVEKRPAGMMSHKVDTLVLKSERSTSLSDLLDTHSALFIKTEGRGALSTASFRGTAASHTDVLWNGMSVQSPMLGQVDFSLFPVYLFDDISINPGNSSLAETSGALGGSIQLDNKADWSKPFNFTLLTGFGSYRTFNNFLKIERAGKQVFSGTRVYFNRSKNDFSFINKNIATLNPVTGSYQYPVQKNEQGGYQLMGIEQNFTWRLGEKGVLTAHYWFQDSRRSLPRLNTYEGDDHANINRQKEQTHRGKLQYSRYGKKGKWTVSSGLVFQHLNYTLQNLIGGQGYQFAVRSVSTLVSSYNAASYDYQLSQKTLFKLKYSFDFHHVATTDSVKQTGYNRYRREHKWLFLWEQQFTTRFSTTVLLRKEWINGQSVPLIPFAGFEWIVHKKWHWIVRGNVARNVHIPDLNDLYWQPGGNPNLQPEEGLATEMATQIKYPIGKWSVAPEITAFYNNIKGWILWLPAPAGYWQAQNIEKVVAKGIEFSIKIRFSLGRFQWVVMGNYAYTRSENQGNPTVWGRDAIGKQLPYIPVHSGNVFISLHWRGFGLNYINNAYSERFTTSSNQLTRRDWLYPYFMNDLSLSKTFSFKRVQMEAQWKVHNLFNESYRSVLGRPMPGRNYLFLLILKI